MTMFEVVHYTLFYMYFYQRGDNMTRYKTKYILKNETIILDSLKDEDSRLVYNYHFDILSENGIMLLECSARFFTEEKKFELLTITTKSKENNGYGSFAMKKIIELAIKLKADCVYGFISPFDVGTEESKNQVHGFYKKHFAEIRKSSFYIDLKINKNILELLEIKRLEKRILEMEEDKRTILKKKKLLRDLSDSLLKQRRTEKKITNIFKKLVGDKS